MSEEVRGDQGLPRCPEASDHTLRCSQADIRTLRITSVAVDYGPFKEVTAVTITDGERTGVYLPMRGGIRSPEDDFLLNAVGGGAKHLRQLYMRKHSVKENDLLAEEVVEFDPTLYDHFQVPENHTIPRCDKMDGSTLRIMPSYTEAGFYLEAQCIRVTDGVRVATYVPQWIIAKRDHPLEEPEATPDQCKSFSQSQTDL